MRIYVQNLTRGNDLLPRKNKQNVLHNSHTCGTDVGLDQESGPGLVTEEGRDQDHVTGGRDHVRGGAEILVRGRDLVTDGRENSIGPVRKKLAWDGTRKQ